MALLRSSIGAAMRTMQSGPCHATNEMHFDAIKTMQFICRVRVARWPPGTPNPVETTHIHSFHWSIRWQWIATNIMRQCCWFVWSVLLYFLQRTPSVRTIFARCLECARWNGYRIRYHSLSGAQQFFNHDVKPKAKENRHWTCSHYHYHRLQ